VLRQKLLLVFAENPSSLNKLIGYVELIVFHEISPDHSLTNIRSKRELANSSILNIFLMVPSNAAHFANCLIVELLNSSTIDELGEGAWKDGGAQQPSM